MRILNLAFKDLLQILRDWKSALFLLVMPVLFTLFFGFIFGDVFAADQAADPRLPVGIIDHDGNNMSTAFTDLLAGSDVVRPGPLDAVSDMQASQQVADGDLAAAVIIPAGYADALLADQPMSLEVIADAATPAGQTAATAIETTTQRLLSAVEIAHISTDTYAQQEGFTDEAARQAFMQAALDEALTAWQDPPLAVTVEKATGAINTTAENINGFTQSSPGMIVQFAIFGLITSAMVLMLERKSKTLSRLLTTPTRPVEVIAGHVLAMFIVVLLQQVILIALGQFAFGVDYLHQPFAIGLMVVALAIWAASLGLLIGTFSKTEDQVIVFSLVAMFFFAALGGAWFPLEVAGKTFAAIGHLMPTAWAMDGFQNIIMRGQSFGSVLLPAGMLLGYAVVFYGLAVWRFGREQV